MPVHFSDLLRTQIILESGNYYTDNYDRHRFGEKRSFRRKAIDWAKRWAYARWTLRLMASNDFLFRTVFLGWIRGIERYLPALDFFYEKLADERSRKLLLKLVAFRILGHVKVRLPLSTEKYWNDLESLERHRDAQDQIRLNYQPWMLYRHEVDQSRNGISLYLNTKGVYTTFYLDHYRYAGDAGPAIEAENGDVVIDLGGCYGDTALYFGDRVGQDGCVHTFEFIPKNLEVMRRNLALNPKLEHLVRIVERPVWNVSGKTVYFKDFGAGSTVKFEPFEGYEGSVETISVDDFVESNGLERVDFIKTDIEGAEPFAIQGAVRSLRRFRPKLAISIYHSMGDFVGLIRQIAELDLAYKFYLGHATIYSSETVLFCIAE